MKKMILLAMALLIASVFMSGCITETLSDDPIVGIWEYNNLTGGSFDLPDGTYFDSITYVFSADGTGYSLAAYADTLVSEKLPLTWENLGDGKYSVVITGANGPSEPPAAISFALKDGVLSGFTSATYTPKKTADYAVGLWTGIRGDYKEYTDIQVLLYLGADGTGNAVVYGPDVLNLDEIFTAELTWKAEDDKVILTGEKGVSAELPLVNGELIFSGLYPLHKYTVEDNLYNGVWQSSEPYVEDGVSYTIVEVIKYDGTGVEIWTVPGSDVASYKYPFTWEMTSSTTYTAFYDDGEVWLFEIVGLQLFDGGLWYNKVGFDVLQDYAENKVTA